MFARYILTNTSKSITRALPIRSAIKLFEKMIVKHRPSHIYTLSRQNSIITTQLLLMTALTECYQHLSKTTTHIGWQTQDTRNIVVQPRFFLLAKKNAQYAV